MLTISRLKILEAKKETNTYQVIISLMDGSIKWSVQCAKRTALRVWVEREVWQYHNLLGKHIQATASHYSTKQKPIQQPQHSIPTKCCTNSKYKHCRANECKSLVSWSKCFEISFWWSWRWNKCSENCIIELSGNTTRHSRGFIYTVDISIRLNLCRKKLWESGIMGSGTVLIHGAQGTRTTRMVLV